MPTSDGQIVSVPFIRTTWTARDQAYRRRRRIATAAIIAGTVVAVALSALFIVGLARGHDTTDRVLAAVYASTVVGGVWLGRGWIKQTPTRPVWARQGFTASTGLLVVLLIPLVAGFGIAVVPSLFGPDFPGERRARELTDSLNADGPRPSSTSGVLDGAGGRQ